MLTNCLLVPTVYGQVLVNRYDVDQTNSLLKRGRAIDDETIRLLGALLCQVRSPVFLDVGANIGVHSLALHEVSVEIHAFEPQRLIYNLLCGTLAINGVENVRTHNVAVGDTTTPITMPRVNYREELQFGGVRLQGEMEPGVETVPQITLDSLDLPRVDVIKIDVEGMEAKVLSGAGQLIAKHRPVMLIEHLPQDYLKGESLPEQVKRMGYKLWCMGIDFLFVPEEKLGTYSRVTDMIVPFKDTECIQISTTD